MATASVRAAMFQTTRDTLKRRFDALKEQQNNELNFHAAEMAYLRYLGEDRIAGRLTKEAILEGRIFKPDLQKLFNAFTINTAFTKSKQRWFSFWDEDLENKFHLKAEFLEMMTFPKKDIGSPKIKHRANKGIAEENILITDQAKEFSIIQRLHNDLMERVEREIAINEALSDNNYSEALEKNFEKTALKLIKSITVVKGIQKTKPLIVINSDYNNGITIKEFNSKHILSLYDAISNGRRNLNSKDFSSCKAYLNSNKGCALYRSKDGHRQTFHHTKIVDNFRRFDKDETLEVVPEIKLDIISHSEYSERLSKQLNKRRSN